MAATYTERAVSPGLRDHVVCTWQDRAGAEPNVVLPDACLDVVWDGAGLFVAGPDTGPVVVEGGGAFVGIRFRPGSAPGFLGVGAHELIDRQVALAELWGGAADELAERLAEAPGAAADTLERALLARLDAARPADPLVGAVLGELGEGGRGDVVRGLVHRLGVSERTLHRRCTVALGYGPKTLDRILRFRRALRIGRAGIGLAEAAFGAGYADQAHLTREFRRLARATQAELVADRRIAIAANGLSDSFKTSAGAVL